MKQSRSRTGNNICLPDDIQQENQLRKKDRLRCFGFLTFARSVRIIKNIELPSTHVIIDCSCIDFFNVHTYFCFLSSLYRIQAPNPEIDNDLITFNPQQKLFSEDNAEALVSKQITIKGLTIKMDNHKITYMISEEGKRKYLHKRVCESESV